MPAFVARAEHVGCRCHGTSDDAFIDQLAAGLDACSQHGIRGTTHTQLSTLGLSPDRQPFLVSQGKRLLTIGMLAGPQGAEIDRGMGRRNGQIEDRIDFGIREQVIHGIGLVHAMLGGLGAGALDIKIRAGGDFGEVAIGGKALEIGIADLSAPDHPDAQNRRI